VSTITFDKPLEDSKTSRSGERTTALLREARCPTSVGKAGFESAEFVEFTGFRDDWHTNDLTRVDVSTREVVAFGPTDLEAPTVENALAGALARASAAGRWDIVAQLARELDARRLSAAGVRSLVGQPARPPR
jgi:hypothetical protein